MPAFSKDIYSNTQNLWVRDLFKQHSERCSNGRLACDPRSNANLISELFRSSFWTLPRTHSPWQIVQYCIGYTIKTQNIWHKTTSTSFFQKITRESDSKLFLKCSEKTEGVLQAPCLVKLSQVDPVDTTDVATRFLLAIFLKLGHLSTICTGSRIHHWD